MRIDMTDPIQFIVDGCPRAKQSFRYRRGGGYTDPRVKAWQTLVAIRAREAMAGRAPITGPVAVCVVFVLPDQRRRDLDNLSKGVLDAIKTICFLDDSQITCLHLVKHVKEHPGVFVQVFEGGELPPGGYSTGGSGTNFRESRGKNEIKSDDTNHGCGGSAGSQIRSGA